MAARIKALRLARGLTQDDLAERTGLAVDSIRRLEHDGFSPSLRTLDRLADGLRMSVGTLLEHHHDRPELAELCDFLYGLNHRQLTQATRVLRSLFDGPPVRKPASRARRTRARQKRA